MEPAVKVQTAVIGLMSAISYHGKRGKETGKGGRNRKRGIGDREDRGQGG
jgi:hypothetical protein